MSPKAAPDSSAISLLGKAALITGGTRGIGRAIVLQFASCGANVAFVYRKSDDKARSLIDDCEKLGVQALGIKCDAADTEACAKAVEETISVIGNIDILVNNVAISDNKPFLSLDAKTWKNIIDVNINSLYNFTFPVVHHMRENKSGSILNIGSICGIKPMAAVPVHYSTTKGAMNAFTFTLAKEVSRYNISVNSIAPGLIATDFAAGLPYIRKKEFERFCPLGRMGTPEEVARMASFIVSDLNSYMTGETVVISGGL